jgi:hypothetical protein
MRWTSLFPPPPLSGDTGVSKLGAPAAISVPPSPRSPLPESQAVRGSRFWVLADESSNEEELTEPGRGEKEVLLLPRSGSSEVTLGNFLSPAWQQVGGSRASAAGQCRGKFAPGGRCSWTRRAAPMRLPRSRSPPAFKVRLGE